MSFSEEKWPKKAKRHLSTCFPLIEYQIVNKLMNNVMNNVMNKNGKLSTINPSYQQLTVEKKWEKVLRSGIKCSNFAAEKSKVKK